MDTHVTGRDVHKRRMPINGHCDPEANAGVRPPKGRGVRLGLDPAD